MHSIRIRIRTRFVRFCICFHNCSGSIYLHFLYPPIETDGSAPRARCLPCLSSSHTA